jgi:hypothetical protein
MAVAREPLEIHARARGSPNLLPALTTRMPPDALTPPRLGTFGATGPASLLPSASFLPSFLPDSGTIKEFNVLAY